MEKTAPETYDKYIKALSDISRAITSEQYLEDILKLIVMVTAKVMELKSVLYGSLTTANSPKRSGSRPPRLLIPIM